MTDSPEPSFFCDVMLGGLARWLRAAGYDARWVEHIEDPDLIREAARDKRVLLSSDTGIFRVGIVRDGDVPALMVPHGLTVQEQLGFVLDKLGLPLREPRCMGCGGELREVPREQVKDRVPPRSFAHADRFWECSGCDRLFWRGTHWERIAEQLRPFDRAP
ncbi:MAG: Mut7-C RNAse domain-containing protein [Gemmataceae bacterium]|nr:Mut7-C RNAse domain-containing protein [Gemmataceae bacterium]